MIINFRKANIAICHHLQLSLNARSCICEGIRSTVGHSVATMDYLYKIIKVYRTCSTRLLFCRPIQTSVVEHFFSSLLLMSYKGAQWLSGRVLDSRPRGRGFEPHRCRCVVSLSKNINPSLVLVQPRKARPLITERLLMGRKESNQTNKCLTNLSSFRSLDGRCQTEGPR